MPRCSGPFVSDSPRVLHRGRANGLAALRQPRRRRIIAGAFIHVRACLPRLVPRATCVHAHRSGQGQARCIGPGRTDGAFSHRHRHSGVGQMAHAQRQDQSSAHRFDVHRRSLRCWRPPRLRAAHVDGGGAWPCRATACGLPAATKGPPRPTERNAGDEQARARQGGEERRPLQDHPPCPAQEQLRGLHLRPPLMAQVVAGPRRSALLLAYMY